MCDCSGLYVLPRLSSRRLLLAADYPARWKICRRILPAAARLVPASGSAGGSCRQLLALYRPPDLQEDPAGSCSDRRGFARRGQPGIFAPFFQPAGDHLQEIHAAGVTGLCAFASMLAADPDPAQRISWSPGPGLRICRRVLLAAAHLVPASGSAGGSCWQLLRSARFRPARATRYFRAIFPACRRSPAGDPRCRCYRPVFLCSHAGSGSGSSAAHQLVTRPRSPDLQEGPAGSCSPGKTMIFASFRLFCKISIFLYFFSFERL